MSDVAHLLDEAARLARAGDFVAAGAHYAAVLSAAPGHRAAMFGQAQVALARGDVQQAAQSLTLLAAHPEPALRAPLAQAFTALAHLLRSRGAYDAAVMAFDQATRLVPDDAQTWLALGSACMEAAQAHVDRSRHGATAAAYDPLAAAQAAFARAAALAPGVPAVVAARAMAARHACDFAVADPAVGQLERASADPAFACEPLAAVTLLRDAHAQRAGIEGYVRASLPRHERAPALVRSRGTRLRVGYLSSDLHDHATAHLAAGMFELHDRARLEVYAYATDRDDGSAMRARLRGAFEHWRDLRDADDAAAATLIARDGLDVLVDLKGHTRGVRWPILERRPAPAQVHWLGFPGTLGAPGTIDALVADAIVAPPGSDDEFAERVLRLPMCYQANDHRRVLPPRATRAAVGLPDDAVVLASFNQSWKLAAPFVAAWLAVMREQPATLLWLTAPHALTQHHLRTLASRAGVAPQRLVFAPLVSQQAHLARLQCADVALDVLPYGSHTTGSDALFCGVPLLSLRATTFAGRVGASLLAAVDLPELVADSMVSYTAMLANLAADRARRTALREHLEQGRGRLPLYDTEGFTRAFERMLESQAALG